jgi:hypothetical protein
MKKKLVRYYSWNTAECFKGNLPKTWRWETSECDCCSSIRRFKTYRSWRMVTVGGRKKNYDKFFTSTINQYAKILAKQFEQDGLIERFEEK